METFMITTQAIIIEIIMVLYNTVHIVGSLRCFLTDNSMSSVFVTDGLGYHFVH